MRASVVLALLVALLALSGCAQTRLWRSKQGSLMRTIREPAARTCGTLLKPKEYCGIFDIRAQDHTFAGEKAAEADPKCVRFYEAAVYAGNVLCDYESELTSLHSASELSDTPYVADRIKQIHIKYQQATEEAARELDHSYGAIKKANEQQERTYRNVAWSLGRFYERISLVKPRNSRRPASMYPDGKPEKTPENGCVPDLMNHIIVPMPKRDTNSPRIMKPLD